MQVKVVQEAKIDLLFRLNLFTGGWKFGQKSLNSLCIVFRCIQLLVHLDLDNGIFLQLNVLYDQQALIWHALRHVITHLARVQTTGCSLGKHVKVIANSGLFGPVKQLWSDLALYVIMCWRQ